MTHEDEEPEESSDPNSLLDLIQQHLAESNTHLKSISTCLSKPTLTFGDGIFFGCGFAIAAAVVAIPAFIAWTFVSAMLVAAS